MRTVRNVSPDLKHRARSARIRALVVASTVEEVSRMCALVESSGPVDVVGKSNDGAMAVEIARTLKPDLAVLDLDIPQVDVSHAATQIKMLVPGTKVLLVSEGDDVDLGLAALDAGADAFMCKRHLRAQWQARITCMFSKSTADLQRACR